METQTLKLTDIRTDGGTQSRAEINTGTVSEYTNDLANGAAFPPVVVFYDGKDHWLADGFHRLKATHNAGIREINADIRQGSRRDAILYSVGANSKHGLRRTPEDKRRAVRCILSDEEWAKWSDRMIAEKCDVGHPLVAKIRAEMFPHTGIDSSVGRQYVNKSGNIKTMNTGNITASNEARKSIPITRVNDGDVFYEETAIQREEVSSLPDVSNRPPVSPFHTSQKITTPLNNRDNDRRMPVTTTPDSKSDHMAVNGYTQPGPAANTTVSMVDEVARLRKEVETLTTEKQAADDLITVLRAENTTLKGQLEAARKLEPKPSLPTLAAKWNVNFDQLNNYITAHTSSTVSADLIKKRVTAAVQFYIECEFDPEPQYNRVDLIGTLLASAQNVKGAKVAAKPKATPKPKPEKVAPPPNPYNNEIVELIETYLQCSGVVDPDMYAKPTIRKQFENLAKVEVTPDHLQAYISALRVDRFWRDKAITVGKVMNEILPWLNTHKPGWKTRQGDVDPALIPDPRSPVAPEPDEESMREAERINAEYRRKHEERVQQVNPFARVMNS